MSYSRDWFKSNSPGLIQRFRPARDGRGRANALELRVAMS